MGTNDDKYLILRGKNKDIYFIQKRVSKKISSIIGKDFIKKSLETSDILVAREKRNAILKELQEIELKQSNKNVPINTEVIDVTQALNHLVDTQDPHKEPNLRSHEYKNENFSTNNDPNQQNVPIEIALDKENVNNDGYFSFLDYSKSPQKDAILAFIDKITPLAIIFLVIFVFFSV
tara:strand:+ start:1583 stop:2113 length:531 start_codon:yes stop_codon:yes gene_type:complete